jgi:hypothetical protein
MRIGSNEARKEWSTETEKILILGMPSPYTSTESRTARANWAAIIINTATLMKYESALRNRRSESEEPPNDAKIAANPTLRKHASSNFDHKYLTFIGPLCPFTLQT